MRTEEGNKESNGNRERWWVCVGGVCVHTLFSMEQLGKVSSRRGHLRKGMKKERSRSSDRDSKDQKGQTQWKLEGDRPWQPAILAWGDGEACALGKRTRRGPTGSAT